MSATVLLMNMLPTGAPAKTVSPTRDTTSVLHNPAMGLVTYTGIYPNGDLDMIHNPRTPEYSNILYIRAPWSRMEPTEGNYVWLNPNFRRQLQSMRALGFRLAFRVMCQDTDTHGTPEWVLQAINGDAVKTAMALRACGGLMEFKSGISAASRRASSFPVKPFACASLIQCTSVIFPT